MPDLFGAKLRALRRNAKITQMDLAREIDLAPSNSHISKLELSQDTPSLALAVRIAQHFAVSIDYLLRDTFPVYPIPTTQPPSLSEMPFASTSLSLGERIRRLRSQHDLTQRELARRVGLAQGYLSKLEAGSKLPSLDLVVQLADALGVTTDDLLRAALPEA